MLTENKDCAAKDLGGGVARKVLSYDETMMVCELTFKKAQWETCTTIRTTRSGTCSAVPLK